MKSKILVNAILLLILGLLPGKSVFAQAENVFLSGATGSAGVGSTVEVEVKIQVEEPTTAAKIYINYDSQKLTGESIDVSDSGFVTTWPEATFDSASSLIKLQAGQVVPGVSGEVKIATLRFSAKEAGTASFGLNSSSLLLNASDQNLIGIFGALGTLTITAPSGGTASGGGGGGNGGGGGGGSGGSGGSSASGGACAKRGDVDCNSRVDIVDLSRLLANWKRNFAAADFNKNGIVDIVDLSILLSNWKK